MTRLLKVICGFPVSTAAYRAGDHRFCRHVLGAIEDQDGRLFWEPRTVPVKPHHVILWQDGAEDPNELVQRCELLPGTEFYGYCSNDGLIRAVELSWRREVDKALRFRLEGRAAPTWAL